MTNSLVNGLRERISNAIGINNSVGVILPGNNYSDLTQSIFDFIYSCPNEAWVYVAVTRPYENILQQFPEVSTKDNIKFIDCISRAAGLMIKETPNCTFIESPAFLEKILMEITNIFKAIGDDIKKTLIIDSLSSLLIYNDDALVTEFYTHLINRTRLFNIHSLSLAIEEEMDENINKALYLRSNKIIKLRESFI